MVVVRVSPWRFLNSSSHFVLVFLLFLSSVSVLLTLFLTRVRCYSTYTVPGPVPTHAYGMSIPASLVTVHVVPTSGPIFLSISSRLDLILKRLKEIQDTQASMLGLVQQILVASQNRYNVIMHIEEAAAQFGELLVASSTYSPHRYRESDSDPRLMMIRILAESEYLEFY